MDFKNIKNLDELIKRAADEIDPLQYAKPWEPPAGQITVFDIERFGDSVMVYVEVGGDIFRAIPEHHIILDEGGSEIDNKEFEDKIWEVVNFHV